MNIMTKQLDNLDIQMAVYYGGPQVSCQHFSFEFDKTFFMQQNLIFGHD